MHVEPFEASVPPDLTKLSGLRHELAAWLDAIGLPASDRDAVVLATHEAAANGIEHACSRVLVRGVRDDDKLLVIVTNNGRWRGRPKTELRGGRGLTVIGGLTSALDINVDPQRTTVRMRIDLRPDGRPGSDAEL